jgi:acyl-coenzyme A thioesterase PaaI-like protein
VCDKCWTNFFSHNAFREAWKTQFQGNDRYFHEAYTTTLLDAKMSAALGCNWCRLLAAGIAEQQYPPEDTQDIKVNVRFYRASYTGDTLVGAQCMGVKVGRFQFLNRMNCHVFTNAGKLYIIIQTPSYSLNE